MRTGHAHESDRKAKNKRTHFSTDDKNSNKQRNHLWSRSVHALREIGIPYRPKEMTARWAVAYRRRYYIERHHRELVRVNDALDRVRNGIMEQLAQADFAEWFETDEGRNLAEQLLRALVDWDLTTVASMAAEHDWVRLSLERRLGVTEQELTVMRGLAGDDWEALSEGVEVFGRFYDPKASRRAS